MSNLEQYLSTEYLEERREIEKIRQHIADVAPLFVKFCNDKGMWPYEVANGKITDYSDYSHYSHSTHAMILFTMAVLSGRVKSGPLVPQTHHRLTFPEIAKIADEQVGDFSARFKETFDAALGRLREKLESVGDTGRSNHLTESGTYGKDDPLTLSWLVELLNALGSDSPLKTVANKVRKHAKRRVKRALKNPERDRFELPQSGDEKMEELDHAFPLLRACHLYKALGQVLDEATVRGVRDYFERKLHLHLSYYMIPDSRFDPAELVFSLDGCLMLDEDALDKQTIERVFNVIRESQKITPYWRPVAPIIATQRGKVLYPLSVEVANALLRICACLDGDRLHDSFFSENLSLFTRYAQWLRARIVRGKTAEGKNFCGWHSEHVSDINKVHTWETSQVLLYLHSCEAMLQDHIARKALVESACKVGAEPRQRESGGSARAYWENSFEKQEPLSGADKKSVYRVYKRIRESYVVPHGVGEGEPHYSMLLYGPPGTGKSAIPEELAEALGWRLITVTTSDFLAQGEAEVESRAKAVFRALEAQKDAVILFDEIDHFILDRESKLYRDQHGIFQFMTPGMLTKLKDLRSKQQSIFILATNYAERIDNAAMRLGRIDDRFLILPPDRAQREKIFREELLKDDFDKFDKNTRKELLGNTCLFVFTEMERMVEDSRREAGSRGRDLRSCLLDKFRSSTPTITLTAYRARFGFDKQEKKDLSAKREPFEEFLLLTYLVAEAEMHRKKDQPLIKGVLKHLVKEKVGGDKVNVTEARLRKALKSEINDSAIVSRLMAVAKDRKVIP